MEYIVIAVLILVFIGFSKLTKSKGNKKMDASSLKDTNFLLVDCRTKAEFSSGHIDGAVNIPFDVIAKEIGRHAAKDRHIAVYCHSGSRSGVAAKILKISGYQNIVNLGSMSRAMNALRQ